MFVFTIMMQCYIGWQNASGYDGWIQEELDGISETSDLANCVNCDIKTKGNNILFFFLIEGNFTLIKFHHGIFFFFFRKSYECYDCPVTK